MSNGGGLVRNESLRRGLLVLGVLARSETPLGTAQVARLAGLPKATVNRLLLTLVDESMACRDDSGAWLLGPAAPSVSTRRSPFEVALRRADEVMSQVAVDVGESTLLTQVRLPDVVEVLKQYDPDRLITATRWTGRAFDPRRSVAGWLVAAQRGAPKDAFVTPENASTRRALNAGVRFARTNGYAIDVDGLEQGLTSLAVVALLAASPSHSLVIGVAGPTSRLTDKVIESAIGRLQRAATELLPAQ